MKKGTAALPDEIRRGIADLGDWFHNLDLHGIATAPGHLLGDYPRCKWNAFSSAIPADLRGWTVLDIGCNAGFYALEMKKRGADRVVGIDGDVRYLAQARFAAEVLGIDIELEQMSVYEVAQLREKFDLVLFMGVLSHLRHPLLALDLIHRHVARDMTVVQSVLRGEEHVLALQEDDPFDEREIFQQPGYPKLFFVERRYSHDPTSCWIPNRACLAAMLRSAGFAISGNPEPEVFVCRRVERLSEAQAVYAASGGDDHD